MMNPTARPDRIMPTASGRNPGGFPRQLYDKRIEKVTIPSGMRVPASRPFLPCRGCTGRGGHFRRTPRAVNASPIASASIASNGARRKMNRTKRSRLTVRNDKANSRLDRRKEEDGWIDAPPSREVELRLDSWRSSSPCLAPAREGETECEVDARSRMVQLLLSPDLRCITIHDGSLTIGTRGTTAPHVGHSAFPVRAFQPSRTITPHLGHTGIGGSSTTDVTHSRPAALPRMTAQSEKADARRQGNQPGLGGRVYAAPRARPQHETTGTRPPV